MPTNLDVISRLNEEIERILNPFMNGAKFAYVDYPDHSNVGDSAIWLGAMAFFARAGTQPSHVAKAGYFDIETFRSVDVIFLHGGGNFGDIWSDFWPNSQAYREAILEKFPGKRIIQLPQTIHFKSPLAIDRAARLIEAHKNFTLLVRDQSSLLFAQRNFQCTTILCPDTAFALGPLLYAGKPKREVLYLLRTDKERVEQGSVQPPPGGDVRDWLAEPRYTRLLAKAQVLGKDGCRNLFKYEPYLDLRLSYYQTLAMKRLARGIRLLSGYHRVVTDRLHVHILNTLLGIPHIVLDNNYGKISGLMGAFHTDWDGVRRAGSLDEALSMSENTALGSTAQ